MDAALAVVAEKQLGEGRPVAARKRGLGAALLLQLSEGELGVLAGAELARRIIGARAEIVARPLAADRHAVARFRDGGADPKLCEEGLAGEVLEPERLLASELAAQAALPGHRR